MSQDYFPIEPDHCERIAAVMRRLYSQDRMNGDCMRDAAQMLDTVMDHLRLMGYVPLQNHAAYDARLRNN